MIVHVGMHKSGTSAVQDSLAANLKDPNFKYLAFEKPNNSNTIRHIFWNAGLQDENAKQRLIAERQRRRSFVAMTRSLNALGRAVPIVSAEIIGILPRVASDKLFDMLEIYRRNIQIVAYLRNMPDYVDSAFQEKLKSSLVTLDKPTIDVRYKRRFVHFERRFSRRNVLLKPFSRSALHNGCVVQDFCKTFEIDFDPAGVVRSNERLSLPAVRLLYAYRQVNPAARNGDRGLFDKLSTLPGSKFQLSDEMTRSVVICEEEDLAYAQDRIGLDMRLRDSSPADELIRSADDLRNLKPEELEWLAANSATRLSALKAGVEPIAAALDKLRVQSLTASADEEDFADTPA
ncbi:MAG: hypothetical protein AB7U46_00285 [Paenirhodobacter sp.]|uniref:hypothetical protein n=1 Tax=Paenirhodobacter sp. TaxID=1965326 RepID=UPI003D104F8B